MFFIQNLLIFLNFGKNKVLLQCNINFKTYDVRDPFLMYSELGFGVLQLSRWDVKKVTIKIILKL